MSRTVTTFVRRLPRGGRTHRGGHRGHAAQDPAWVAARTSAAERNHSRPGFPRSIMDFQRRFATEDDCRVYLFDCRWPDGFICPGCGGRSAGQATRRNLWICTACKLQTSVTAGTVMHATRTAATDVVLGGLPGRHAPPGDLGQAASAPARPGSL